MPQGFRSSGQRARPRLGLVLAPALALVALGASPAFAQDADGQQIFTQSGCSGCHGTNGEGGIGPKLAGNQNLADANHVITQIVNGGGPMPAFGNQLSDDQIAAVASYIRTSWGNDFGEVDDDQVEAIEQGGGGGGQQGGGDQQGGGGGQQGMQQGGAQQGGGQASAEGSGKAGQMAVGAPAQKVKQPTSSGPTQAELDQAGQATDSWLMYSKGYLAHRYSTLEQINAQNAGKLEPVCIAQLGEQVAFQAMPIVYKGVLYITTPESTFAFDATDCHQIWKYTWSPKGPEPFNTDRGVAIADGRLFRGTDDGHVLALDAKTGKLLWDIRPVDSGKGYFLSQAPIVWNGMVLMGTAGADWGANAYIFAFDEKDGHTIWKTSEVVAKTFGGAKPAATGGGSNWTSFALDTRSGLLYASVGNPAPDFAARYRPGKNLYTNSVLVLDAKTGRVAHYYQQIPNDALDRDTAASPVLFNLPDSAAKTSATPYSTEGKPEDVDFSKLPSVNAESAGNAAEAQASTQKAAQPGQSGNRMAASAGSNEAAAGGTGALYVAVANKAGHLFLYNDKSHQLVYRVPTTTISNARAQPTIKGTHACPGINGGVEWYGPSYDPTKHRMYVGSVDWCSTDTLAEVRYTPGQFFFGGSFSFDPIDTAKGWIVAYDAGTGKRIWKYKSDLPVVASVTPTAGDVLFSGELTGDFIVLDADTGKKLYSFNTGGPIGAGIATYEIDGRQYVAVPSGNMSRTWSPSASPSATLVLFALPQGESGASNG